MWNSPGTSCTPSAWARGKEKLLWSNFLLKYPFTTDVSLLVQIGKCETRPISGMVMVVKYLQSSFTKQERDLNTELAEPCNCQELGTAWHSRAAN